MSVKTYTDSTTRIVTETIEEHVWEIHCDAIGCNNSLEFRENQDTGDITADGELHRRHGQRMAQHPRHQHRHPNRTPTRWQEGNKGIQRGHLYCPTHNENQ